MILSFAIFFGMAHALLIAKTPEDLYNESDVVLIGRIDNANGHAIKRVTDYAINVEKYLKNDLHQQILYITSSGSKNSSLWVEDEPIFDTGERVLLYLNKQSNSYIISPYSTVLENDGNNEFQPPSSGIMSPYSPYHPEIIIAGFVVVAATTVGIVYYFKIKKSKK